MVLAIALVWMVIGAIIFASIRQFRNPEYRKMKARYEKQLQRVEKELDRDHQP